jgi:hypothetical protein
LTKITENQKFSKEAFVDAAKNSKDRLLLKMLLKDGESYAKEDVTKVVKDWKSKEVKA